jgi:cyclophilin family peptidyl-prolyl cis-trans isomerase
MKKEIKKELKKEKRDTRRTIVLILILLLSVMTLTRYFGGKNMKKIAVFETSMGNFEVELNEEKAPISTKNFISYVNEGFYNGLIFHRVIGDFMIQGGGFDVNMDQKQVKAPIKNEAANGLKNEKYTLAMARTSIVDSATAQFFINVEKNDFLNHWDNTSERFGYAVFGKVVSGFETVDKIKSVKTRSIGGYDDVPVTPVVIIKAYMKN